MFMSEFEQGVFICEFATSRADVIGDENLS